MLLYQHWLVINGNIPILMILLPAISWEPLVCAFMRETEVWVSFYLADYRERSASCCC